MNSKLKEILNFTKFTQKFRAVNRRMDYGNKTENDAEHSYQLAIMAWYIIDTHNLDLDIAEVIKCTLVHDLVETYVGDVSVFDDEGRVNKKDREKAAIKKLAENFPEFGDMHTYIQKYEDRNKKEVKFVYTLDKLMPLLNIYLDGGNTWRQEKITFKNFLKYKSVQFKNYELIKQYFEEMVEIVEEKQQDLFHQDN